MGTIIEIWFIIIALMLVAGRLQRAFNEPALPARVASLAGIVVTQPATGTGPAVVPEGAAA